ncbi:GLUTATHIONE S-TRANSFERASE F6-RELATED [Salix viminalis]|uniref:glutathione transferase n=1 Tax=Salix viminalis TaxID=40686 RepID=A0A9Q0UG61_SALVM|nr:GLUTATHIONE S-TRANSFERASE F6-RELATED [Salix viminalis]
MAEIMKVHGSVISTATQRVLACLNEKELEFEFIPVNMAVGGSIRRIHSSPSIHLVKSQLLNREISSSFESRAITQYIAHGYAEKGTTLIIPGRPMATLSVWMEVEAHQFDPVASKLNWELFFKPMFGIPTDNAAVEENEAKLTKVLDVYEARLAQSKYLGGDIFTLADLHHLPNISCAMKTQVKKLFDCRPHVSAWVADITSRPAWCKVVAMGK